MCVNSVRGLAVILQRTSQTNISTTSSQYRLKIMLHISVCPGQIRRPRSLVYCKPKLIML